MGNKPSVDTKIDRDLREMRERKYPELFYKGMEAAQAGRYTVSEACFAQVLRSHPMHSLIDGLLKTVGHSLLALETGVGTIDMDHESNDDSSPSDVADKDGNTADARGDKSPSESAFPTSKHGPLREEDVERSSPKSLSRSMATGNKSVTASSNIGISDIPFFLDHRGEEVMHYQQIRQDMEYIYVACNTPKAHQLAMMYASRNCAVFHVTVHAVGEMWKKRKRLEAEGNGARNRILEEGHISYALAHEGKGRTRNKFVTEDDVVVQIDLVLQHCRSFWISSATNYGMLAVRHANNLTETATEKVGLSADGKASREAARERDRAKRARNKILVNVMENCEAIIELIVELARMNPEEYVNMVILRLLPDVRGKRLSREGKDADGANVVGSVDNGKNASSYGGSSKHGSSSNEPKSAEMLKARYEMLGSDSGAQSQISDSRAFTPVLPVLLPLHRVQLPVRFVPTVDQSGGAPLKSQLARVVSPTARNCWRYVSWTITGDGDPMAMYAGATSFLLCKGLPQYFTEEEGIVARYHKNGLGGKEPPTGNYVDMLIDYAEKVKPPSGVSEEVNQNLASRIMQVAKPNRDLDMTNRHVRSLVLSCEVAVTALPLYGLLAAVYKELGMDEDSRLMARAAVIQCACFYGPESMERYFMQNVMQKKRLL